MVLVLQGKEHQTVNDNFIAGISVEKINKSTYGLIAHVVLGRNAENLILASYRTQREADDAFSKYLSAVNMQANILFFD